MKLRAGQSVDRYVLLRPLGAGGDAEVWEATQRDLGVRVALKVLSRDGPGLRARLLREGRAQAAMRHPHILPVRDVIDVGGSPGLVLALVEGPSLRALLDAHRPTEGESAAVALGIVAGLAHAHAHGLVHCDLKPGNVLLDADGRQRVPRVADFGITRHRDDPTGPPEQLLATLRYAAPEQLVPGAPVDHRADLFAVGVLIVELLTGELPFDACTVEGVREAHRRGPELSRLSDAWRELCADLLAFDVARRVPDCVELERRLTDVCGRRTLDLRLDGALAEAASRLWETGRPGSTSLVDPTLDAPMTGALPADGAGVALAPPRDLGRERDVFVGRARELGALEVLVGGGARLVTLIGTAGVGKTRLARHFARRGPSEWAGGAWFCDLSEARSLDGVCIGVAAAVDASLGPDPVGQVGAALARLGRCLVILDNAEQVVEHAASAVHTWREAAPEVSFVVTSRRPLGLPEEVTVPVEPLEATSADLLFLHRARLRRPELEVAPALLSELTTRLDRLPLAIELAAARIRSTSPEELVADLRRGGPGHATLQAAIDRSWELLEPWQRSALAQLAVFEGGFTLEAAEEVVDLSAWPEAPWMVDVVRDLVDRSLVVRLGSDPLGEPRFGMSISTHAYATARREDLPDGGAAAVRRHASYFARFDDRGVDRDLGRPEEIRRMCALEGELQNLLCAARRSPAESRAGATRAAVQVLRQKGPYATAITLIEEAVEVLTDAGDDLGVLGLLIPASSLHHQSGRSEGALRYALRALEGYRAAGHLAGEAFAHNNLGILYAELGRAPEAIEAYVRAVELHARRGDVFFEAVTRSNLGALLLGRGRVDEAEEHYLHALGVFRERGARTRLGHLLGNLAIVDEMRGRVAQALERYTEAIAITHETGASMNEATSHGALANLLVNLGEVDDAREHFAAALALLRRLGARRREGETLGNLGVLYQRLGQVDEARAHYRLAVDIAREVGDQRGAVFTLLNLSSLCRERGELEAARAHLEEAQRFDEAVGNDWLRAILLFFRGAVEGALGDHAAGRALFEQSEALLRAMDAREMLGLNLGERALLECRAGDPDTARRCVEEAEGIAEALGMGLDAQLVTLAREVRVALQGATAH